jgi:hypothetical protein
VTSDTVQRLTIIILGLIAGAVVFRCAWHARANRPEAMGMVGGGVLCVAVSSGTLGVLLGFDTVYRLPVVIAALLYIILGRTLQLHRRRRSKP